MLSVRELDHSYGAQAILKRINLDIGNGEVISLAGPNGAGKSTLLRCMTGIVRPASGSITINGRAIEHFGRRELARTIAYVPQQAGMGSNLAVIDMVALGRSPYRGLCSIEDDRRATQSALERLDLLPLALRPCNELSGGERQRVLIARALAQEGQHLLLDEPTNNLDIGHQLSVMSLAIATARERGMGVVVAIHDLSLAARFSDRVLLMREGRVLAEGSWQNVLTKAHVAEAYGVGSIIGEIDGIPYVIPRD